MLARVLKGPNLLLLLLIFAGLLFSIFILIPDGRDDFTQGTTTKIYFADNISSAHIRLIDKFNEIHRGQIEVVPVDLPFMKFSTNERKELLSRSFRSKTTRVDVFAVDLVWVPRFVKWAEPLTSHFSSQDLEKLLPSALTSCYQDSELVSMPFYIDIGLMYYRRDLLAKIPGSKEVEKKLWRSMSWDEFVSLRHHFDSGQGNFYLFPAESYEGLVCSFFDLVGAQQISSQSSDTLRLESPLAIRALQLLVDLVNKYEVTPKDVTTFKEIEVYERALSQNAPFFRGWPGNLNAYRDDYPHQIQNIGLAALPHLSGSKPSSVFGGWNLMVSKYSEKKKEAIEFIEFVTQIESQKTMYEEMGYLPINASVYEDEEFTGRHPQLHFLRKLLDNGVHRPALVEYTRISDILSYYIRKAIQGEIPPARALHEAHNTIRSKRVFVN